MTFLSTFRTWWKQMWCEHEYKYIMYEYFSHYPKQFERYIDRQVCAKCLKSKKL